MDSLRCAKAGGARAWFSELAKTYRHLRVHASIVYLNKLLL